MAKRKFTAKQIAAQKRFAAAAKSGKLARQRAAASKNPIPVSKATRAAIRKIEKYEEKILAYARRLYRDGKRGSEISDRVFQVYGYSTQAKGDTFIMNTRTEKNKHFSLSSENPGHQHLAGATQKQQRQYEHILKSARDSKRYPGREKEVAARTVRGHANPHLTNQETLLLKSIAHFDPAFRTGGLASISEILHGVRLPWSKATKKRVLKGLIEKGLLTAHYHDYPAELSAHEKSEMIILGRGENREYYIGVALRDPGLFTAIENPRRRNRTIIKAKRAKITVLNPRARNKAGQITEAELAKLPEKTRDAIRAQLGKLEQAEAKASTPKQRAAVAKRRRSLLSRIGTRLRLIGQTKKFKVSARDLSRCKTRVVKVRARHETDAIAKAQAKLGRGFDEFRTKNCGGGDFEVHARKGRRRNADHKDADHPVEVTKHWRQGPPGYLTPWQRAHAAGQRQLFETGIRAATPRKRRNPSSAAEAKKMREEFAGRPARRVTTLTTSNGTPRDLAKLGRVIRIKTTRGIVNFSKNPQAETWLCADRAGHMHLATSLPRLTDLPRGDLGRVVEIDYLEAKPHLGNPRLTHFFHRMGEEGGQKPVLYSDGRGGLKFRGGDYRITREGIRN